MPLIQSEGIRGYIIDIINSKRQIDKDKDKKHWLS